MKKSAFISDLLFTFFSSWLITLCVFRYLKTPLVAAVLLSGLCGLLIACAWGAFFQSKRNVAILKRSDEAAKEKLLLHLSLLGDGLATDLFARAFSLSQEEGEVKKCGQDRLQTDETVYFIHFRFSPVTADEIAAFARRKTSKRKILLCAQIEENAFALCKRLGIETRTGEWAFLFLKKQNALPESYLGDTPREGKVRRHKLWFAKTNSRRFLTSGALVLLFSFLTPFSYYYVIFGALLLLAAIFTRIFGYS